MSENLYQPYLSPIQDSKRREILVSSFIILVLFAVSIFFFFISLDTQGRNLVWAILWSLTLLCVGLAGIFLYKTTKPGHMRVLQISFYCLIFFSSFLLFFTFIVAVLLIWMMTAYYKFYVLVKTIYYAFCVFIAWRGMTASKSLIDSMILQNQSLNVNNQVVSNPFVEMELHSSSNILEDTEQESDKLQYYYPANNNSPVTAGHYN